MLHCLLTSFGSGQATQSGAREPYHKRDRKEMIEKRSWWKGRALLWKNIPETLQQWEGGKRLVLKWSPISFGPLLFWTSRNLGLMKFGPQEIWTREIWYPRNIGTKKFGLLMKMIFISGPNFAGPKFLGGQKGKGPIEIGDHFSTSPAKYIGWSFLLKKI